MKGGEKRNDYFSVKFVEYVGRVLPYPPLPQRDALKEGVCKEWQRESDAV